MRLAFALFILLSACGAKRSSGPAWPKMSEKETDGGESIAPRAKASAIAAAADKDDDKDADDKDDAPAKSDDDDDKDDDETQPESDTNAATSEATEDSEETIITTEEIVIEIDDED